MSFYKSEKVLAKTGLNYTGLKVGAGDNGKVIFVRQDLISILWDKDKRQLARLCPPNNILKAAEHTPKEIKKRAFYDSIIKVGQNPKSLARQFMSEDDYDNFKKLLDLRKLYSEENVGRSEEGLKGTRTELKDINEKIDSILDKYKNTIMNEFDLKANLQEVEKFVKRSKKQPWSKAKEKENLKSQSVDRSDSADVEVENVKPGESNVLDYGEDPLAQDNYSGSSS